MAQAQRRVYAPPPESQPYQHAHHDDEPPRRQSMVLIIMLIVMVTGGYVLWTTYGGPAKTDAPVIAAQDGAFKERYDGPPVDELATAEIDRALEGRTQKAAPPPAPSVVIEEPLPEPRPAAVKAAAGTALPAPAATARKGPPPRAAAAGGYVVQIAALRSATAADAAWDRLARRDPALFANASKDVQRADLGSKGIYFRVRAGYFTERDEASRFCDRVKTMEQECIVVVR